MELGVAAAMKAMANKTMVTTEKGKQKAQPKPKEVPLFDCKWCDKQHKHKEDQCWYNPSLSADRIPAEFRARVLKRRNEKQQKKNEASSSKTTSSITEMET